MSLSEDLSFLRFFLTEPVYLVKEPEGQTPAETQATVKEEDTPQTEEQQGVEASVSEVKAKTEDDRRPEAQTVQDKPDKKAELNLPEYEGENQKGILILHFNKRQSAMKNQDKVFLGKVINAVSLNFRDVALCNWAPLEVSFEAQKNVFESLQQIKSEKILVFGDLPLAWSLSHFFQPYTITQDAEGRQLLLADDLQSIAADRELKVKLWGSLQKLFKQ